MRWHAKRKSNNQAQYLRFTHAIDLDNWAYWEKATEHVKEMIVVFMSDFPTKFKVFIQGNMVQWVSRPIYKVGTTIWLTVQCNITFYEFFGGEGGKNHNYAMVHIKIMVWLPFIMEVLNHGCVAGFDLSGCPGGIQALKFVRLTQGWLSFIIWDRLKTD